MDDEDELHRRDLQGEVHEGVQKHERKRDAAQHEGEFLPP